MKKSTFVVVVVLALALCVPAVAFAALSPSSPMANGSRSAAATCPNYADRNANGACDRHENGACPGYTDADGDGVCDNYQDGACSGPGSTGCRRRRHMRQLRRCWSELPWLRGCRR